MDKYNLELGFLKMNKKNVLLGKGEEAAKLSAINFLFDLIENVFWLVECFSFCCHVS